MASRYPRHRVRSYVRSDGTRVRGHYRANRGQQPPAAARSTGHAGNDFGGVVIGFFVVLAVIGAFVAQVS